MFEQRRRASAWRAIRSATKFGQPIPISIRLFASGPRPLLFWKPPASLTKLRLNRTTTVYGTSWMSLRLKRRSPALDPLTYLHARRFFQRLQILPSALRIPFSPRPEASGHDSRTTLPFHHVSFCKMMVEAHSAFAKAERSKLGNTIRARLIPSFAKEGWLRHKENGPVP